MHLAVLAGVAFAIPAVATAVLDGRGATSHRYPVINTTYGAIQGTASDYRGNVTVYKGIPFAAPPTGPLRWKAPVAPNPWSSVLEATDWPNQCPQASVSMDGIFQTTKGNISENCLYLNIWTPSYNTTDPQKIATKNLPVYVWIFGGRFEMGSANVPTYDGSGFATQDIIVVTLNYRMSAFGFLAHPELSAESGHNSSGNYGLLDQQFALQWVQNNIAQFGGNPNRVTVGGQSAGSASALDVMWSPLSKGLAHGVIAESGALGPHDPYTGAAATSYRKKAPAEAYGVSFLKTLNVSSIDELRNVSMDTLLDYAMASGTVFEGTQFANMSAFFMEPPEWRPVIDGYVLPHTYGEALRLGAHADVPILTGNNADESGASTDEGFTVATYKEDWREVFGTKLFKWFLQAYPVANATQANDRANELFRDMSRVGTWQWANVWAAGGAQSNVYTYYWTHVPPVNGDQGAYHGSELWYVFNNIPYSAEYASANWTATDLAIEKTMNKYWANFIRSGDPNGDGLVHFPPSTNGSYQTMWLGNSWGVGPISESKERVAFIEKWYSTLKEW